MWDDLNKSALISIHAPRVGSDYLALRERLSASISIHAPRVGSDTFVLCIGKYRDGFQSTLPVWGATTPSGFKTRMHSISIHAPRVGSDHGITAGLVDHAISIHAPRVGSDRSLRRSSLQVHNFNPRSPCGERQVLGSVNVREAGFQSTLPVWGATIAKLCEDEDFGFQSTLPVWGATRAL